MIRGVGLLTRNDRLSGNRTDRHGERGYLLVSVGVLILLIIGLLGSYGFVLKRDTNYKAYYAAGERFAVIATAAHYYAQRLAYDTGPVSSVNRCDLYPAMNIAEGGTMTPIKGVQFTVEICGADAAPVSMNSGFKAASAYVHLKIRNGAQAGIQTPSDLVAFMAGAAAHGMKRVGIVGVVNAGITTCGSGTAALRWGLEPSACLSNANITSLGFTDIRTGDMIVPAWETALALVEQKVIYRHPQPERSDLNAMMDADLHFAPSTLPGAGVAMDCNQTDVHCLRAVAETRTERLTSSRLSTFDNGLTTRRGTTPADNTVSLQAGAVINNNQLIVYDQTAGSTASMQVAGPVVFPNNPARVISIADTLARNGTGTLDVGSTSAVATNVVGGDRRITPGHPTAEPAIATALNLTDMGTGATLVAKIDTLSPLNDITELRMTSPTNSINIVETLSAPGNAPVTIGNATTGPTTNLYAATLETNNATPLTVTGADPIRVGTIDQRVTTTPTGWDDRVLHVRSIEISQGCNGKACPTSETEEPGGGL